MYEHYPVAYHPLPQSHDRHHHAQSNCPALLQLATIGAVVGASTAAGSNIRRVQRAQITASQAFADTGRAAVSAAVATAVAGAVATAVSNEGLTRLGVLFAAGTAAMYGIQRWREED